jgi:hypothetical protein
MWQFAATWTLFVDCWLPIACWWSSVPVALAAVDGGEMVVVEDRHGGGGGWETWWWIDDMMTQR